WGDYGHRQYLPVSYAGFLYGAAMAWCGKSNRDIDMQKVLARFSLASHDERWARLWLEIGRVPEVAGTRLKNRTILFNVMEEPLEKMPSLSKIPVRKIKRLRSWLTELGAKSVQLRLGLRDEAELEADEFLNTSRLLIHATVRMELAYAIAASNGKRWRER